MQFLGSANDRVSGPNEDNGFGSAFPDYSNLPGGSVTKENSFGLPSFGQQPRNYDRHELGSSDREYGSFNLPQLMAAAAQNRQDTTGQGSSATTSFPSLNNEEHPFLPDTFSLQADSGRDDQAPDFVAGSGIVAADSSTRGPPAGVFGSGRQPDESFFDSL
uniref:Uncharacterized protein n=1 Tax=Plectus sambesii TaxID=2011161 RepID=A0A914WQB4_9BILA